MPRAISALPRRAALAASAALLAVAGTAAHANEALIRKNLSERLPNLPRIEEVRPTPMRGLFEIRLNGTDILYTDAEGNYLIQGVLIDTKARTNLTEERLDKLTAIAFESLPLKDAFTVVRGNGQRKLAVFADPNCGFCKRFERDLAKLDNVTIHTFLYPVLGKDSEAKSRAIWCARDRAKAWNDWMQRGVTPPEPPADAKCDTAALERNIAFGQKYRITGTPTTILANGTRLPGAVGLDRLEPLLAQAGAGK
ncbi:DsbC family protein [Tepidimonas taiwanensis]|uniref:Thiol:disulfide interchange protein n=1 Tax=Tepidimonas taiwanensis TaxID=307486 RepID=A0A554XCD0_9BURK|nr:DsbC family protein [Tepidimonas taiwanensis]MCX7692506.1 DsbC family protein [Tepidimonas taiwanensis]MDM7462241.1 DsbC family protein [Tepidimonas taiwanensis]TSE33502.1 putative thiol:disulfide interchange protein DsbC [Tepidimonas taiwanensis]UBQ05796.1 DsbC family protein [Tepidimonas taiwanensis]